MKKILFLLFCLPSLMFGNDLKPTNWVNDYAGLLSSDQLISLNNKIAAFERQTDIELSFAIVTTLDGRDVESYASDLFKSWKIGKKDRNNGLLVVIAPNERKWRIEIGYGLEAYLTDYQSSEIGNRNFKPNFKAKNYYKGINDFVDELTGYLGTATWTEREAFRAKQAKLDEESRDKAAKGLFIFLGVLALITLIIFIVYKWKQRKLIKEALNIQKAKWCRLIESKIDHVNFTFSKYPDYKRFPREDFISRIKNAKTTEELETVYANFTELIDEKINLANAFEKFEQVKKSLVDKCIDLNSLEKSNDLPKTKVNIPEIEDLTMVDVKAKTYNMESQLKQLDVGAQHLIHFMQLRSCTINFPSVEKQILEKVQSFKTEEFKADEITVKNHLKTLEKLAKDFNSEERTFKNYETLKSKMSAYTNAHDRISNHLAEVSLLNSSHRMKVSELSKSESTLSNYRRELDKYLSRSDVKTSTKSSITTLIASIIAFKVLKNVDSSYKVYSNLVELAEAAIKNAKADIAKVKREKEEEERSRRRRSSYSSSPSYWDSSSSSYNNSSDSGSSFGGFGGGDSGGGGSSGDW